MNKDTATTMLGLAGGVIQAVNPIISMSQNASLHSGDWMQIGSAIVFSLLGYFTNKK